MAIENRSSALPAEPEPIVWRHPSRSQKKRDARAVGDLGRLLIKLTRAALKSVPLEDDLRESILLCRDLTKGAHARQLRSIRKQLSDVDLDPIREALRRLGHLR
jgi:ribosome-associated protein